MAVELKDDYVKNVYSREQVTSMFFTFLKSINEVKNIDEVCKIFMNIDESKFEIYVFYEIENFDVEDKITRIFTNFEKEFKFFPEIFIYPLDMIENIETTIPNTAVEL